MHEAGVGIVQATRKPERLKSRIAVGGDVAPGVITDLLGDGPSRRIHNQHRAAHLVGYHPVLHSALDDVIRHVGPRAVHELLHNLAAGVGLGDWIELSVVQEPFHQCPVHLLAHQPAFSIIVILDARAVRQRHFQSSSTATVQVSRYLAIQQCAGIVRLSCQHTFYIFGGSPFKG